MYCIIVKTPPLCKGLNIIIIILIPGVLPGPGGYARGILINFGLDYEKICIYILHDVLYVHLYVYAHPVLFCASVTLVSETVSNVLIVQTVSTYFCTAVEDPRHHHTLDY